MTSRGPSVSVVIPSYNYASFLPQAIDSVLAQTFRPHEVIVVDDGSTDDTPQVLARYRDRVRVVRKENGGLAAARNSGVAVATGDLLAFLDSDDLWLPAKLERELAALAADPEVGLVHCGGQEVDAAGRVLEERVDGMAGWVAEEMLMWRRTVVLFAGSTMLVPRRVFDAVGGFDARLRHSEDWDFCYRVATRHRFAFVAEPLVQYRLHGANMHLKIHNMREAMLLAYAKAFEAGTPDVQRLRRRAYGNLHTVLAGSFFATGRYGAFLRHATQALLLTPENLPRFLGYPARWLRRRREGHEAAGR